MRRTSPAVALLLTLGAVSASPGLAATDNWNAPFPDASAAFGAASPALGGNTTTCVLPTYDAVRTSCVACIRDQGVWCSRFWIPEKDDVTWTVPLTLTGTTVAWATIAETNATMNDNAACCLTQADLVGDARLVDATSRAKFLNKYTCGARYTNDVSAGHKCDGSGDSTGTTNVEITDKFFWCSDGRTNQAAIAAPVNPLSSTVGVRTDPRTELFLMQCRQGKATCGG